MHRVATPRVHEFFAQVMSVRFVPDTSHEWGILDPYAAKSQH